MITCDSGLDASATFVIFFNSFSLAAKPEPNPPRA
jgi:hypothetical protein